ncbi:MAG: ATP-binding protein [Nitrospirota bacterium]|nr:ATP-binding protein [Nitrospirota bacterium]MDH5767333.1 ATP-binding protein [Nitrospirota bacterium]
MKKLRFNTVVVLICLIIIGAFLIELHYMRLESVPFFTKLTVLVLMNLTIISLLTLMFFVSKNLVRLYFERRNKVLGYKFKTKLVVILVVLTLIPTGLLFIISSGLVTNYIERWFTPQLRQPLDRSIEIAKSIYEFEKQKASDYAKALSSGKATDSNYTVRHLKEIPKDATETVRAAFDGKADVEVISGEKGDTVRAVAPEYKEGRQRGIIVVESFIPKKITENVENIKDAYENYLTLESWKVPIKTNYLLILGFFTLLVIFMALWIALKISRGITDPIESLAQATEQVAAGNLNIRVDLKREDEIGLLVNSFNHMVNELKEGKETIQSAYLESNRRRLFMENILENINSGVIMLDTTGNILMINSAACSILDINPEAVMNKHYKELMTLIKSEELKNLVKGIEGREFRRVKKEIKAIAGGRKVIIRVFITSLRDPQKYIGLLVVFDDLTDIIRAEKALTWQEVLRRIAHEIKNPLTPIKLSTERMVKKWEGRDDDFDHIFDCSTKTIIKEVDDLKRLVDEFSRFGKMPEIHKKLTHMPTIIDEVVNLYKGYKGVEINVSIPEENPLVELDGEQFKRVMKNIFDNAIDAISHEGRIDVKLQFDVSLNRVYIDIADNGPGIRDEDKEKLFLPYFSTKRHGTGLGLVIADRIIAEHRGNIRIMDNEPKGTIFTIAIPIKES